MDVNIFAKYFEYLIYKDHFILGELLSSFIPLIFLIFNFKSNWIKKYFPIYIYSIILPIFEIVNNCYSAYSMNNHDIYLVFYLIETLILFYYFSLEVQNIKYSILLIIFSIFTTIFFLKNIFSEINLMNNYASSFQSIIFIVVTLFNFYFILIKSNIQKISESSFFIINVAFFIYFSGKLFVSLYLLEINNFNSGLSNYWGIVSVLLIFCRILISIGIYKSLQVKSIQANT